MKGTPSDVRFLLVLLTASLCANVFLVRRLSSGAASARPPAHVPTADEFRGWLAKQPRQPMPIPRDGSRVTVVKFNDYQCPPCRMTHEQYRPVIARLQAAHPGAITVVLKDFPLASECNSTVTGTPHPAACAAAVGVRLAARMGKRDELSDWLFANQASLTVDSVRSATRMVTGREYGRSDYEAALAEVKEDVALGAKLGVNGTPTFFVNGMLVEPATPQLFEVALEYELSRTAREARAAIE